MLAIDITCIFYACYYQAQDVSDHYPVEFKLQGSVLYYT